MDNERAVIGDNSPPIFERLSLRMEELLNGARKIMTDHPKLITDKEVGERLGGFLTQMKDLRKEADDARAAEKKPHQDLADAVDAKWMPISHKEKTKGKLALAIDAVTTKVNAFLDEQNRLIRVAREAAAAEQARLQKIADDKAAEAAELLRKADAGELEGTQADPIQAQIDAQDAAAAVKVAGKDVSALKGNATVGQSFTKDGVAMRGIAQKTYYHAKIDKPLAALAFFAKNEKLLETLQALCTAHVRDREGNPDREPPPGCSVYTTSSAS